MGLKDGTGPGPKVSPELSEEGSRSAAFRYLAIVSAVVAYLTVLLGAGVTFSDTPLVCPTWPGCSPGQFIPTLGGPATLEFSHRALALVLSLCTLGLLALAYLTRQASPGVRRMTFLAAVLVILQALLGGAIIFSDAEFAIVVFHLGLATLLFGILILIAVMANFPFLPPRWQASLVGSLSKVGEARSEMDRMNGERKDPPSVEGGASPSSGR